MIRNIKLSKKLLAGLIAISLIGTSFGGYKIHRSNEIKRVKGYLDDFIVSDNYVDLSKITSTYDIKDFHGEYLYEALQSSQISYVRITDSYIYDGQTVTGFKQKNAVNYNLPLGIDNNGDIQYAMYEPISIPTSTGITYSIPEGYELEDITVIAEPIRYEDLKDKEVVVQKNSYEDSYSLILTNDRNR